MKTYDIDECAAFLNVGRTHALTLASNGEIPGAKIGREWVFLESDLVEYLQAQVRKQVRERRARAGVEEELATTKETVSPLMLSRKSRRTSPDLSQFEIK